MKVLLTQYSEYHLWANGLIIDCIQKLPESLQTKEVASSFPGLSATLLHLWDAQSIWWQRLKLSERVIAPSQNFSGSFGDICEGVMAQSAQWNDWVLHAQPHMLEHEFIYYNSKKEKFKQPTYQVLLQVFNHSTYHRGQLVTILRELGITTIPATDFILWSRKK